MKLRKSLVLPEPRLLRRSFLKQTQFWTQFLGGPNSQHGGNSLSVDIHSRLLPLRAFDARPSPEIWDRQAPPKSPSVCVLTCRETLDGEVLPLVAVDQALVAVKDTWDLDSAINGSAQASGVFKMLIPTDIDPKGDYAVRTDFRPEQSPPTATPTTPVEVPEPVATLIVLGDMKIHHERSLEEPPAHFLEGEDVDEAESDEDQAGGSTPEPPRKRTRMVTAGNLATLGLADEGFTFVSVLESHVPAGPAKQ